MLVGPGRVPLARGASALLLARRWAMVRPIADQAPKQWRLHREAERNEIKLHRNSAMPKTSSWVEKGKGAGRGVRGLREHSALIPPD